VSPDFASLHPGYWLLLINPFAAANAEAVETVLGE
jgi:hypothetical protein